NHVGSKKIPAPRHGFEQSLVPIIESPAQFQDALHQRIIGDKCVWPDSLHEFLLADQALRVLHEVFEGFIDLGPKLYLLCALKKTRLCEVQGEIAELIA